jgi:hypothetical protein
VARSRNLKPGFFTNDVLAEVNPLGRLLFQGLWCHADREGRVLDRPKKLKVEILPYDDCDVDLLLNALAARGFILRYEVSGNRYIQIINFAKHQNPHIKESASTIPAPDFNQSGPADSLNPLTLTLNPSTTDAGQRPAPCMKDEIVKLYHEALPMCPRVEKWTDKRDRLLKARWKEHPAIELWMQYFSIVVRSRFLTGKTKGSGDRPPFLADFEWLICPGNFAKVLEGKYDNR